MGDINIEIPNTETVHKTRHTWQLREFMGANRSTYFLKRKKRFDTAPSLSDADSVSRFGLQISNGLQENSF